MTGTQCHEGIAGATAAVDYLAALGREVGGAELPRRSALRAAFDMFDADQSGYIDRQELSVMLRKLGFEWQGAHVFEAADTNQDGKVSFAEFLALFGKGVTKVQGTR